MPAFISLEGQRFDKLVVLSEHEERMSSGRVRTFWKCLCDCGKTTWAQVSVLQSGHKRSCNCLWDSTLPEGEADLRAKYRSYKAGAPKRKLDFSITIEDFKAIASQNCHYCGEPPPNTKVREVFNGSSRTNGIDRKNNLIGYVLTNCLPCCQACNRAKGTMTYEDFISLCRKVSEHVDSQQNGQ